MKRKLKWLAIAVAVSLLGFGTVLLFWPREDRITSESYEMIQIGMTEKEVVEILGGPGQTCAECKNHMDALQKGFDAGLYVSHGGRAERDPDVFDVHLGWIEDKHAG